MANEEVLEYLDSFTNHEKRLNKATRDDFKLERVTRLLSFVGSPHKKLRVIHTAGSKGKGSTSAMVANILKHAGYRVGLFASPHIENYNERIRILNLDTVKLPDRIFSDSISDQEMEHILNIIKPYVEIVNNQGIGDVTFYELFTAMGMYYFYDKNVDFVVLETGLGGRLDASNCCKSIIAAITSISHEHTRLLGNTLAKIAFEKAGIIKKKTKRVVLAPQRKEALGVLLKRCKEFNIEPFRVKNEIVCTPVSKDKYKQTFHIKSKTFTLENLTMPLLGKHQLINAKTACGIIEEVRNLKFKVPDDAIVEGLKNVVWPCRFELIDEKPYIIVDGAHNAASVAHAIETYKEAYGKKPLNVIFGTSEDKKKKAMLKRLVGIKRIITTKANHPRAYDFKIEQLKELFPTRRIFLTETVDEALSLVQKIVRPNEAVLIIGSLFVAREARRQWLSSTA